MLSHSASSHTAALYTAPPLPKRGILIGFGVWTLEALLRSVLILIAANDPRVSAFWITVSQLLSAYVAALVSLPLWYATMWLAERSLTQQIVGQILLLLLFVGTVQGIMVMYYFATLGAIPSGIRRDIGWVLFYQCMHYGIMLAVWYVLRSRRELRRQQEREQELRQMATQMELAMLKSQMNPHFLFNTLNTVSALVGSAPELARTVLAYLADILRYALDSDRHQYVRLEEEVDFATKYLAIEQARFGNRLQVRVQMPPELRQCLIPPMVVQPLVENAVKHGLAPKAEGGYVSIEAQRKDNVLTLKVSDNGVGMALLPALRAMHRSEQQPLQTPSSGGRGLAVTDARLKKLFGETAGLHLEANANGASVVFAIPIILEESLGVRTL